MGPPAFILVRHAAPQIDEHRPATEWRLSDEGRRGAADLADRLRAFGPSGVIASPEPKANETAGIIAAACGLPVTPEPGLAEHRRNLGFLPRAQIEAGVAAYFATPAETVFGEESGDQAYRRFERALASYPARPLAAVSHGTVISTYLARRLGLEPMMLWRGLKLPEAFVLDENGGLIARL